MKLLYLLNQRLPTEKAYGIQVIAMCQALAAQGADVELMIPWRDARLGHDVFGYYKTRESFKITRLRTPDFYFPVFLERLTFVVKQSLSGWMLVRDAVKRRPDIIYTRDESVALLASFFTDKIIFEAHTFSPRRMFFYRRLRNKRVRVITITHRLKTEFERMGMEPSRILAAPDGVYLEDFDSAISQEAARQQLGLPLNKKIVMYVGHLFKWKGADILAQAATELSPDIQVVIGGGTERDIKRLKEETRVEGVRLEGFIPFSLLPVYLHAADLFVLPNKKDGGMSEFYTSPLKLFAYMAAQRPIVASDLPSIREVLNETNSFLVPSDDPHALATGIQTVLQNRTMAEAIAQQAFVDVRQYSWQNRAASIVKFLGYYPHELS